MPVELAPPDAVKWVVEQVFKVMVRLDARISDAPWQAPTGKRVTSLVTVSGPIDSDQPNYSVSLEMSEELAMRITSTTLRKSVNEWSHMVEDAVGEITNMIAGNLKKHMIATHVLSIPVVAHGSDYDFKMPTLQATQEQVFSCESDRFLLTVGQVKNEERR